MQTVKISIIGAGNVAWHLSKNLFGNGFKILQVFSRNIETAQKITNKIGAQPINSMSKLSNQADIIIICVSDSAIPDIISQIPFEPKLIVHTAGSVPVSALKKFKNYGVFYPLQSFTKNVELDISNVPFCIEANNDSNKNQLISLAKKLSNSVYELNSEQRLQCHIAAVFANNFSNHMFHVAEQILAEKEIPFDIIKPLISETAKKVQSITPGLTQTGPAVRNDEQTIAAHLKLLSSASLEKIYSFVSQNIWNLKKGQKQ
jgi:predicted short-subunit dehydrogenase-like oxidoreductase (DUF2520 family)